MASRVSLGLVCVALAGCSDTDSASPPGASTQSSTQVAAADWKAVIDDWYVDGTMDEQHPCVAVREAIEQLPSRDYSEAYADLLRLARGCE